MHSLGDRMATRGLHDRIKGFLCVMRAFFWYEASHHYHDSEKLRNLVAANLAGSLSDQQCLHIIRLQANIASYGTTNSRHAIRTLDA